MNRLKLLAAVALLGIPLAACEETTPPPPVGSIAGTVSIEGTGIDGVSVNLSNGNTTTTAGGGSYRFDNVEGGAYTITISGFPSDATFDATSAAATISSAGQSVTVNFSGAYIRTASVMGTVTVENMGLGGVTVALSGVSSASAVTDDTGQYAFTGLRMGNYSVEISGFDNDEVGFSNTAAAVTVGVGESKIISFDGTYLRTAGIMGRVSVEGAGLEGVTVSLAGGPDNADMTTMTDAAGQYSFAKLRAGDYAVGISGYDTDDFEFELTSQNVTVALGETANVPFEGVLLRTSGVSGRVSVEGIGLEGVMVTLSMADAEDMTAMTDAGGLYAFSGLAAGDYTVAIALSDEQMAAYVFESTSMDVTLEDDMTAIVNFEADHAATASVTVQLFVDEGANGRNDMMDEGEGAFPSADMLAMVAELGLPLALPISLAGPGVHDMQSGTAMPDGSVVFADLKAGQYQVIVGDISDETLAALPPALGAVLRDYSYGGPATGYPVALTVGQEAMQYAPIDITHTTAHFAVTLRAGEKPGMPVPGAGVTLYADAMGEDRVAEGMTNEMGVAAIRFARAGTSGNMVHAGVEAEDYHVAEGMTPVAWDPQKTYTMGANANDILNLNVDVTVSGATITTEYGGGDALAGWAITVMAPGEDDEMVAVEGAPEELDDDGMAAYADTLEADDLPMTYTFAVDTIQTAKDDDGNRLDGGENYEGTDVEYMHDGLSLAATTDAGTIEVTYTTQTLKVYVHREMDQVEGYTGNILGGDERMSGMIDVDVRYINDAGRSRPFPTTAKIGKSDSKGVVTFTNVPADHRVVAVADEAEQDEEDEDYQSVMLLDPDELAAYDNDDYVMGGAFGPEGGFSHTVELCPLMGPNPSTQDHDECGSFAFVNTYQVSGLVWKVEVEKDDDDDFEKLGDPTFVDGIDVDLESVEGKNLAGEDQSFTTLEKNDKDTSFDDTHQFDFGAIAAGVYKLSVTDGWRVRTPADDDELGDHSPKGSTGMVGSAFNPLAGDIALDVTPATGVLYGRVTDGDGLALDSVTVDVNGQTDMTDEFGRYIVEGFGKRAKGKPIIVKASGEGVTDLTDSTSVAAFAANAPMRHDFSVVGAADVATISGTVTKSGTGDGVAGVQIGVSSKLLNPNAKSPGAKKNNIYVTDDDGSYSVQVEAVAAGDNLTVTASKKGMSFSPASHTLSAVADSEVSGIDFTGFDHATITGRVLKDGRPVSGVMVTATLVGADDPTDSYTTRSTGTFRLSVPFGTYDIEATEADHTFEFPNGTKRITVAPGTTRAFGDIVATENDNRVPAISSDADFEVEEGETEIGTVEAADPDDGDDIEGFAILTGSDNGADHGDISIDAETGELTFNSAPDHDEPADDDEDNVYEITVEVSSGSGARAKTSEQDIEVTVTSVDEWEVTMVVTPDEISEAGGKSVVSATVKPASPTAFAIEVMVGGTADERTVSGTTLFFAADAEESTGTVEITAVNNNVYSGDVDITVDGSVVPSSLENFSVEAAELTITEDDVDDRSDPVVTLTLDPASISEDGGMSTVTASADRALGTAFTVTVSLPANETGATLSTNAVLSFGATAMTSTGDVTITAVDNSALDGNRTVMVSGEASSMDVDGPTAAELTITDDDMNTSAEGKPTITGMAKVGETLTADVSGITDADGMTNATFAYQWISVAASDAAETEIDGATTMTYEVVAGDLGNTLKVSVSFTDDGGSDESVTSDPTAAVGAANSPATGAVTISGTAQVGETLTADASGIMDADGRTNATMAYQWISVAASDDAETDIAGATAMTYDPVDGDVDNTLKVRVSFTDDRGSAESVTSDPTDAVAARPAAILVSMEEIELDEGGEAMYMVSLATEPEADVTVTITDANRAGETLTDDAAGAYSLSTITRVFTPSNWETAQDVTITAHEDADVDDLTVTLTHTAASTGDANYEGMTADVTVEISDDDVTGAGLTVTGSPLTIEEGDADGATYTVVLDAVPAGDVTITIAAGDDDAEVNVTPSELTFTTDNWDEAQEVTVTAPDNDVDAADADGSATLTHEAEGGGYGDADLSGDNVTVTVTDDDVAGVTVTGLVGREVREGGSITYSVKLDTEPANNVSILVTAGTYNETFNFSTTDWGMAQSGTITVPDDDTEDASREQTVSFTVAGYVNGAGTAVTQADGSFQIRDTEVAEVIVSQTDLSIAAGASGSYNVSLTQAPAAGETVTITVTTTGQIGINPVEVELNASNWEAGVDVTLSPLASATVADNVAVTNTGLAAGGGTDSVYSTEGAGGAVDATNVSVDITASGS